MLGAAMLQWGRARASAEICQRPLEFFTLGGCFNGAALVRARKSGISQENPAVNCASMGPRSCERGNDCLRRRVCSGRRCFNGAALVRARKSASVRWNSLHLAAASMGPRSCERGNLASRRRILRWTMLQWGRARASAEMRQARGGRGGMGEASMGPRSCERGNSLNLGRAAFQSRASMGPRSCERGNVLILPGSVPVPCGFNGAALVRARKWDGKGARVSFVAWLQWGRARASAEITSENFNDIYHSELQWGRARASAEIALVRTAIRSSSLLQWGRARASAEIHLLSHVRKKHPMLQWGRARASAEMILDCAPLGKRSICFNGAALVRARKYDGGEYVPSPLQELQWGRARASAEIGVGNGSKRDLQNGFNGAALVRARKSPRSARIWPRSAGFNGAALVRARKCPHSYPLKLIQHCFNGAALVRARKCAD